MQQAPWTGHKARDALSYAGSFRPLKQDASMHFFFKKLAE